MAELPDLPALVDAVQSRAASAEPLDGLDAAEVLSAELSALGDRLVGYFVEQARAGGLSWSDIGGHLGVSRQAAQQRYAPRRSGLTLGDLTRAGLLTRLTARTRDALTRAEDHARRRHHPAVEAGHLLLAILDDPDTLATAALRRAGADPSALRTHLLAALPAGSATPPAEPPVGPTARRALEASLSAALDLGHNYVGTEHLLLGLLADPDTAPSQLLAAHGVTPDTARAAVRAAIEEYLRTRG